MIFFSFQGVRASTEDYCAQRNPCENGGICISVDRGTMCDCRFVPFEGDFCERRKLKMQWHKFKKASCEFHTHFLFIIEKSTCLLWYISILWHVPWAIESVLSWCPINLNV